LGHFCRDDWFLFRLGWFLWFLLLTVSVFFRVGLLFLRARLIRILRLLFFLFIFDLLIVIVIGCISFVTLGIVSASAKFERLSVQGIPGACLLDPRHLEVV
jgi:hypothetical protein